MTYPCKKEQIIIVTQRDTSTVTDDQLTEIKEDLKKKLNMDVVILPPGLDILVFETGLQNEDNNS